MFLLVFPCFTVLFSRTLQIPTILQSLLLYTHIHLPRRVRLTTYQIQYTTQITTTPRTETFYPQSPKQIHKNLSSQPTTASSPCLCIVTDHTPTEQLTFVTLSTEACGRDNTIQSNHHRRMCREPNAEMHNKLTQQQHQDAGPLAIAAPGSPCGDSINLH